ncbi:MAG: tRNA uridine-5-carboxymethylaminomethyl(34) synthesis GTPase MnmE [Gammaproteobacteria bacterium]
MSIVYALATPPVKSAICVFRVSGQDCLRFLPELFSSKLDEPRYFYKTEMYSKGFFVDSVAVVFFKGPKSFTGEDGFEVYAHGGLAVMSKIVEAFTDLGFQEAGPGEFSKRAFLNNKISLSQAEAVSDLIEASSKEEASRVSMVLSGDFESRVFDFSGRLDALRVLVEGEIDFTDEDEVFVENLADLRADVSSLSAEFSSFAGACSSKKNNLSKPRVLIAGPPNTGKSSLFNSLLARNRSIVSSVAGTTRDLIDSELVLQNIVLTLGDSAGVRDTEDLIEGAGINISFSEIKNSDLVILVFDSETKDSVSFFKDLLGENECLLVYNKIDLSDERPEGFDLFVSAIKMDGLNDLRKLLDKKLSNSKSEPDLSYLVRERHVDIFSEVSSRLALVSTSIESNESLDVIAENLKTCRDLLAEVVGIKTSDELLGEIFSSFCIGK